MGKEPVSAGSGRVGEDRYASGFDTPAALPGKQRVLARWGRVGVIEGRFEQPDPPQFPNNLASGSNLVWV